MSNDPQAAALLAHIVSQTKSNIRFLESHNYMTPADASLMMNKLNEMDSWQEILSLSDETQRVSINDEPTRPPSNVANAVSRRNIPTPPHQRPVQARALWAYNENGQEPNDLSFRPGDIIEILTETNSDWWTGRINGRQGLFPSNYVEKISDAPPSRNSHSPMPVPPPGSGSASPNGPFGPVRAVPPWSQPPGPPQPYGYNNPQKEVYYAPPPQQVVVVQDQPAQAPPKKSRFGGLGNTLAQSAAGGVGFGAGAAIGSGIIDAIF